MKSSLIYLFVSMMTISSIVECRKFKIRTLPANMRPLISTHGFNRYVGVFGVRIVAQETICNKNLQFTANLMAQVLDSDSDGTPDDMAVTEQLRMHKATLLIVKDNGMKITAMQDDYHYIILDTNECSRHKNRYKTTRAVLKLIAKFGLASAYPNHYGYKTRSLLTENLTRMVGDCGYAFKGTLKWPNCKGHIFYTNPSCDMECLATEYMTTLIMIMFRVFPPKSHHDGGNQFWNINNVGELKEFDRRGYDMMKRLCYDFSKANLNGNYKAKSDGYKIAWPSGILKELKKEHWRMAGIPLIEVDIMNQ